MDEVSYGVSPGQETTITVHKHQVKHQELLFQNEDSRNTNHSSITLTFCISVRFQYSSFIFIGSIILIISVLRLTWKPEK